ncbi:hypothetical protein [Streptomyces sp. S465]|uniref:hypothetical protein n=1 Tax=Streptomyces sp. S465 TaxID=2979468 RepID=UPI0022A83BFF|nr:hypothetical protein [Streptomyces sp. S465]WAP59163.1 hypothetical protein N6H00_31750 [Streptomyces sp. S465]
MSRDEIARPVRSISDLTTVIQQAEAEDKAEIYRLLGLRLTYAPAQATVHAEVTLDPKNDKSPWSMNNRGELVRVRGGELDRYPTARTLSPTTPAGRFSGDFRRCPGTPGHHSEWPLR